MQREAKGGTPPACRQGSPWRGGTRAPHPGEQTAINWPWSKHKGSQTPVGSRARALLSSQTHSGSTALAQHQSRPRRDTAVAPDPPLPSPAGPCPPPSSGLLSRDTLRLEGPCTPPVAGVTLPELSRLTLQEGTRGPTCPLDPRPLEGRPPTCTVSPAGSTHVLSPTAEQKAHHLDAPGLLPRDWELGPDDSPCHRRLRPHRAFPSRNHTFP